MRVNKSRPCHGSNYTRGRTGPVAYLVVHYVGALGTAEQNAAYYGSTAGIGASAHYFVGHGGEVWQSVEEGDTAWHCGAKSYRHPKCRNGNAIGVELCCRRRGDLSAGAGATEGWYFERSTVRSAAQLADKDIAYVKGQMGYGQSGSGGSSVRGSGGVSAPEIKDYSDYIQAMAEAKKEAALRQLQAAYEKNLAQLEQARGEIAPTYEAARNRAAGQAAQSRRQFNEYAAVHGLGSGAGSQAQLALSNDLQGTLGDLSAREADALGKLELERAQAEVDYNAALAQARSQGDYELAQQLYAEKVRQDEALAQWTKWQAQQDYQNSYFDWQRQQAQRSDEREAALAEARASGESEEQLRDMLFQYAQSTGDYGALEAYYTPQQIARLEEQWRAKANQTARDEEAEALEQARKEAEWAAKYGDYTALKELGVDTDYLERTQAAQLAAKSGSRTTSTAKGSTGYKPRLTVSQVDKAIDNGRITDQVKQDFRYYYGVDYDTFFETGEGDGTDGEGAISEYNFNTALDTLAGLMSRGEWKLARKGIDNLKGRLTRSQRIELERLIKGFAEGT